VAPDNSPIVRSEESTDLQWWPVDSLPANAEHESVNHMVSLARLRLQA
jgi:hypothetical protein